MSFHGQFDVISSNPHIITTLQPHDVIEHKGVVNLFFPSLLSDSVCFVLMQRQKSELNNVYSQVYNS